jgi:hypothetical protein
VPPHPGAATPSLLLNRWLGDSGRTGVHLPAPSIDIALPILTVAQVLATFHRPTTYRRFETGPGHGSRVIVPTSGHMTDM